MYTVAVVVLVAIIAYLIFRLLKQKVPARKKSVVTGDYGGKKEVRSSRNIGLVLLYWLISGTLVLFAVFIFALSSIGSDDPPYLLLWFMASLSVLAASAGIYYLLRGFRSKKGKQNE